MIFLYLIELLIGIALSIFAILFCPAIALFVDYQTGHLPRWLKWFETVDTSRGVFDDQWIADHPNWSMYKIAYTWIARNPAYGYCAWCAPALIPDEPLSILGDISIKDGIDGKAGCYLIRTAHGFFDASFIWRIPGTNSCIRGDYGWQLKTLAQRIKHPTQGSLQIEFLFRFSSFGSENK